MILFIPPYYVHKVRSKDLVWTKIEKIIVVLLNLVEALLQIQDSKKVVQEDVKQEKQPKSAP
jgi:hypothetical protein